MECPKCNSKRYRIKRGIRKDGRIKQRYKCKICNNRFDADKEYYPRMRHKKEIINKALELKKHNLSYQQIADKLDNVVSRQTVHRWCKKYNV